MKVIITSEGDSVDSKFDLRFGRTGWFCVYDKETQTTNFIENSFKNTNGGAGLKTAEMAAELRAKQVISGQFGPKAKSMLEKFQIQMVEMPDAQLCVKDIIEKIKNN